MSNRNDEVEAQQISQEYKKFRILLIGRANSGKTTLLKHISNTSDNSEQPVYHKSWWRPSIKPTDGRGIHDINQSFYFPSNPRFVFHDSPGFETGDETQLKQVQEFIRKRSKARRTDQQLHAIWFCLLTNASRPLLELETKFFNEERAGNVPVIVIFTKFDDLITQIYDPDLGPQENRHVAEEMLESRFKEPISKFAFPPNACLKMEDMHRSSSPRHSQIMKLMEETANCLDSLTLQKLFVSIQQNNLELCLNFALQGLDIFFGGPLARVQPHTFHIIFEYVFSWFPHAVLNDRNISFTSERLILIARRSVKYIVYNSRLGPAYKMFRIEFPGESDNLGPAEYMALLMCAENSFWYCSSGVPFYEAIEKSFKVYKDSESRRIIEMALQDDVPPYPEMLQIVLRNRLPRPTGIDA